jgi:hypothetical protein
MTRPVIDVIVKVQAANEESVIEERVNEHRKPPPWCGSS